MQIISILVQQPSRVVSKSHRNNSEIKKYQDIRRYQRCCTKLYVRLQLTTYQFILPKRVQELIKILNDMFNIISLISTQEIKYWLTVTAKMIVGSIICYYKQYLKCYLKVPYLFHIKISNFFYKFTLFFIVRSNTSKQIIYSFNQLALLQIYERVSQRQKFLYLIASINIFLRMPRVLHRFIKDDIKKYQKNGLYKKQTNILINNETQDQSKRYLTELNFLADQNKSLIDIFLYFFDSIYEIEISPSRSLFQRPHQYNKIFVFLLKMYFLADKFLPRVVKPTQQEVTTHIDIIGNTRLSYISAQALKASLSKYWKEIKIEIDRKFKDESDLRSRNEATHEQIIKYQIVNKISQEQKQKVIEQIINIKQPNIKSLYIPKDMKTLQRLYLDKLLQTLISIRFTKKIYRSLSFSNFLTKSYKKYYKIESSEIKNIKDNWGYQKKFILQRYTNNDNQYLIDIHNLILLRKNESKYQQQSFQMSKQLLTQLMKHQSATKTPYPMLSPKSVIFNQISLKVHLSYDNPLLLSLGLLKKPVNIENMICFRATPEPYDTFATINQLTNPDLLTNHLVGIEKLFNQDQNIKDKNYALADLRQIEANKSQAWRFMMTVYYIMNGVQYYKHSEGQKIQNYQQFKEFVQKEQSKLTICQDQNHYLKMMGTKFASYLPQKDQTRKYSPNIYFFQSLLRESENNDEVIQEFGCIKIHRYLKTFISIFRQLLSLVQGKRMNKIYNTMKYLLRFYLGVFLQLSQIYILCLYLQKNSQVGSRIIEQHKLKVSLNQESRSYIQSSFSKFKEYEARHHIKKQQQVAYLLEKYRQQYQKTQAYNELIKQVSSQLHQISDESPTSKKFIDTKDINEQNRDIAAQIIDKIKTNLPFLKDSIHKIIAKQFLNNIQDENHSIQMKYYKNKLKLLSMAFLYLNSQNYITIQSLIIPILKINQSCDKRQKNNERSNLDYYQDNDLCQYSLQILKEYSVQLNSTNQTYNIRISLQQSTKQHRNNQ